MDDSFVPEEEIAFVDEWNDDIGFPSTPEMAAIEEWADDAFTEGLAVDDGGHGQDGGVQELDWEQIDFNKLFTLRQVSARTLKKFSFTKTLYEVDVVNLPQEFTNYMSMLVMPRLFQAIFYLISVSFGPEDFVKIDLRGGDLTIPHSLSIKKMKEFSIAALMQKMEMMNSQQKFRIDEAFTIEISRTIPPSGGGGEKRKHCYDLASRKRFSSSLVAVQVGQNLCLPAAVFLGVFRLTHDVGHGHVDANEWRQVKDKCHSRLTQEAKKIVADCGFTVGRKFNVMDDLQKFQETCFPDFQIKIVSAQHGTVVIRRVPEKLASGMREIYLHLDNGHYNLITSMKGFLGNSYFCDLCDKPFSNKERHRCAGFCGCCYRPSEDCLRTLKKSVQTVAVRSVTRPVSTSTKYQEKPVLSTVLSTSFAVDVKCSST